MRKSISLLNFLFCMVISYASYTQPQRASFTDKANEKYENHLYSEAINEYQKLVKRGQKTPEILKRLADSYYFNARYTEASKWYGEFFEIENLDSIAPEHYFRYSLSLKSLEQYELANEYELKYYQTIGKNIDEINVYLDQIEKNSGKYEVENMKNLNSKYSDYGTFVFQGNIIFTSSRKHKKKGKAIAGWNNQPFASIYYYTKGKQPELLLEKVNNKINESTPVFTKDGKTVYFTRNNFIKKRGHSKSGGATLLKVYRAQLIKGKWKNVKELPFCSDDYSVAHPALSPDEKTLYFVSDMPGGIGDSDIWKVQIKKAGAFGVPINLGPNVNTPEKESFPFVSDDNKLYYASNGKLGLGGLDIFVSEITEDGEYKEAINMGKPINSPMDDFSFFINTQENSGFFTSNRPGGKGDDDIYSFKEAEIIVEEPEIEEIVEEVVEDPEIEEIVEEVVEEPEVIVDPDVYKTIVELEPEKEMDLAKTLNIIIHFDLSKWNIREDAELELKKLLQAMQYHPKIKVDIRSHTDSRGSAISNEKLSEKRAQSTKDWLVQKGISPDRLTAKGYGETQLVNRCADGIRCSEEEHQANRRSEFIIVGME